MPEHFNDPQVIGFISSYIYCRDIKQAALAANISYRDGQKIRHKKDIHAAIEKITDSAITKNNLHASEIVERVKEIAFFDPADLVNPDGSIKENMRDIPPEARRAIKKFKVKNLYEADANGIPKVIGKLVEVELWDKLKSNELLGREKNLFTEKSIVTHDVTSNMQTILLQAKERAEQRALEARNHVPVKLIDVTPQESNSLGGSSDTDT